jgi:predicted nucleic acid-binding protein
LTVGRFWRSSRTSLPPDTFGPYWSSTITRRYAGSEADASVQQILELGFEAESVDWDMTKRAADFKARHRLSYADCFAAALAQQHHVELVTGDREFRPLEGEIKIHWL